MEVSEQGPFAAQQRLLLERLYLHLETLHPLIRPDVEMALRSEEGKLLFFPSLQAPPVQSTLPSGVWPLLTLLVAQSISPQMSAPFAADVALSMEFLTCALDLFDDLEDGDQSPTISALGLPRSVGVATHLLLLAQHTLGNVSNEHGVPSEHAAGLLTSLVQATLTAAAGQQRDLLDEQRPIETITPEECIEIAAGKGGALMRLACELGAICAGAGSTLQSLYAEVGELLGIVHQLENDTQDLDDLVQNARSLAEGDVLIRGGKTDLLRSKKTLPIVLAFRQESLRRTADSVWEKSELTQLAYQEGIMTAWGIVQLYRERAHGRWREIEALQPIAHLLRLLLGLGGETG